MSAVLKPELVKPDDYKPGKLTKWQPKEWSPVYEQVVALSCANKTNKEIGKIVGFTEVHVGNILRSQFAKAIKIAMYESLRVDMSKTINNNMTDAAIIAARRIKAVLEDDEMAKNHPLSIFDRSLAVLKATRNVSSSDDNSNLGGMKIGKANILITSEAATELRDAIRISDEGRKKLASGTSGNS